MITLTQIRTLITVAQELSQALAQIVVRTLLVVTLMLITLWVSQQERPLLEVAHIAKAVMAVTLTPTPKAALEEIQVLSHRWGTQVPVQETQCPAPPTVETLQET